MTEFEISLTRQRAVTELITEATSFLLDAETEDEAHAIVADRISRDELDIAEEDWWPDNTEVINEEQIDDVEIDSVEEFRGD